METKKYSLRPAIGGFLMVAAAALTTSALSFFNEPVATDLGVGRGTISFYYSLMMITGAIASPFIGRLSSKIGVRKIAFASAIAVSVGFFLFSISRSIWVFYIVGAAMGFFATSCVCLLAAIIVQGSYPASRAAGLLGIVMTGSGICGTILSLFLPNLIAAKGWATGYRLLAVLWLALMLLGTFIMGKPEAVEKEEGAAAAPAEGIMMSEAMKQPRIYVVFGINIIIGLLCGLLIQLPALFSGLGYSVAQVGLLMSLYTAGNAITKILQGLFYGKVGPKKGGLIVFILFALGFLCFTSKPLAICGVLLFALGLGTPTTLLPVATRKVFGSKDYGAIWGFVAMGASIGQFIGSPVFGYVYDATQSYYPALLASPVIMVGVIIAFLYFMKEGKDKKEAAE